MTGEHATPEDCPCCGGDGDTPDNLDASMVTAFVSGVCAVQMAVPMAEALCEKHARLAAEALAFVMSHARRGRG